MTLIVNQVDKFLSAKLVRIQVGRLDNTGYYFVISLLQNWDQFLHIYFRATQSLQGAVRALVASSVREVLNMSPEQLPDVTPLHTLARLVAPSSLLIHFDEIGSLVVHTDLVICLGRLAMTPNGKCGESTNFGKRSTNWIWWMACTDSSLERVLLWSSWALYSLTQHEKILPQE